MRNFISVLSLIFITATIAGCSESDTDSASGESTTSSIPVLYVGVADAGQQRNVSAVVPTYRYIGDARSCEQVHQEFEVNAAEELRQDGAISDGLIASSDSFLDSSGDCWRRVRAQDAESIGQEFFLFTHVEGGELRLLVARNPEVRVEVSEPARSWDPERSQWEDVTIFANEFDLSRNTLYQTVEREIAIVQVTVTESGHELESVVIPAADIEAAPSPIDREIPSFED
jgi:hypothetical protein